MVTEKIIKTRVKKINKKEKKLALKDNKSKKPLVMITYSDGKFSKKDIKKKVQEISKELKEKGQTGIIKTSLHYGPDYAFPWYGGKWTAFGKKIDLFNLVDYEDYELPEPKYFDKYSIFVRKTD